VILVDEIGSSCEVPIRPGATAGAGSRVLRFGPDFRWQGVAATDYKSPADHWAGVSRTALVGESGERTHFHLRYFEIAPGGFSSFEHHEHEHAVVVLRGRGEVQLGNRVYPLGFGDTVYVAPHEPHQFRNPGAEPFGFLCVVDAERDRPVPLSPND
jgi:ribulose-bisphosphate carboxylase large chain